jgi:hypothetical protein
MNRTIVVLVLSVAASLLLPGSALSQTPALQCPNTQASGVPLDVELGGGQAEVWRVNYHRWTYHLLRIQLCPVDCNYAGSSDLPGRTTSWIQMRAPGRHENHGAPL